ncbi:MAG: hypothetical protein AB1757_03090 [Acidobacteriota bacterium]
MKNILIIFLLICLFSLSISADAQSRKRRTPKRSNATAAAKAAAAQQTAADLKMGREQVAAQIKTMTRFLYLFAGITKGIESVDQAARAREASSVTIEANERNKTKVKESINNIRAGLDKLESDFRFNETLKKYFPFITGVARIGTDAESQAAANRFDEAGRSLLKAVNQLTDALALMQ